MIARPRYLEKLINLQDPSLVKVLTGVRRCGKSSLLKLFQEHLTDNGFQTEAIIDIDYEKPQYAELQESSKLYSYVHDRIRTSQRHFLFIDEVQELHEWAKTVNGLRAEFENLDIYVTGSNARMFAGEHLTYLSGRYVQIDVYPLSFAEYLSFREPNLFPPSCNARSAESIDARALDRFYREYISTGSLPAVALAPNSLLAEAILDGLFDSVFTRDIMLRGKIRNEAAFLRIARFALDNIGNQTSSHAIANTLKSSGHPVTSDTVDNYLNLMCSAFLLYRCDRYNIRGKERLRTNGKLYVVDQGLRNRVLGTDGADRGHVAENLVYLELRRRGYDIQVGSLPGSEIDFVASKRGAKAYLQVSESISDPNVRKREIAPFKKIEDRHLCFLITKDWEDDALEDGIRHINLYDFLLGRALGLPGDPG